MHAYDLNKFLMANEHRLNYWRGLAVGGLLSVRLILSGAIDVELIELICLYFEDHDDHTTLDRHRNSLLDATPVSKVCTTTAPI